MKPIIFLIFGILVGIAGTNQAAAEKLEGTALEEHVIAHSPWSGDWSTLIVTVYSGRITYVFERLDGKFSARITEVTGGTGRALGPVSGLSVVKDTIHLTSSAGTRHEFKLNEKGELVGKGTNREGTSTNTLLKPAAKEKK
jgi:hypothetical protein